MEQEATAKVIEISVYCIRDRPDGCIESFVGRMNEEIVEWSAGRPWLTAGETVIVQMVGAKHVCAAAKVVSWDPVNRTVVLAAAGLASAGLPEDEDKPDEEADSEEQQSLSH